MKKGIMFNLVKLIKAADLDAADYDYDCVKFNMYIKIKIQ
jgi:hypothetical protein